MPQHPQAQSLQYVVPACEHRLHGGLLVGDFSSAVVVTAYTLYGAFGLAVPNEPAPKA